MCYILTHSITSIKKRHAAIKFFLLHREDNGVTEEEEKMNHHLELIRLFNDHLQAAVLSQDGLPHLCYPPSLLLLSSHLPLCPLCGRWM